VLDYEGFLTRGHDSWRKPYVAQSSHRGGQMDRVVRFAESGECRMTQLVRHFGDTEDGRNDCGLCDVCAPGAARAQTARPLDDSERRLAHGIVAALGGSGYGGRSTSTGKLHAELCAKNRVTRDQFEELLAALAAAGFVRLDEASFEKDGRTIPYRKASLTHEGATFTDRDAETVLLRELNGSASENGKSTAKSRKGSSHAAGSQSSRGPGRAQGGGHAYSNELTELTGEAAALETRLRAWRKAEAQKLGQPAFCVFSDKTLRAIAEEQPHSEDELLAVAGMGPAKIDKFGTGILQICTGQS
jgi:superfamily II DNA helicase RecQ